MRRSNRQGRPFWRGETRKGEKSLLFIVADDRGALNAIVLMRCVTELTRVQSGERLTHQE
ncbi:MAG: hypothetical protein OXF72_03070 [Gammaproteobacteria bacterium]|nr:hypothetical protein [Gammaproteobacteria bacterium]MCY4200811.1 hypothetical protein [Gammaproteobacteria bacterium]